MVFSDYMLLMIHMNHGYIVHIYHIQKGVLLGVATHDHDVTK